MNENGPGTRVIEGLDRIIAGALEEDIGRGDVTTDALVPPGMRLVAHIVCRHETVVCGAWIAAEVIRRLDPSLRILESAEDGALVQAGEKVLRIEGLARAVLTAERVALNLFQALCGISTMTRRFVDIVGPFGVDVLDTRKTTPMLRVLEKYAVRCGGGRNHRFGLFDQVLIKDNHRMIWRESGRSGLGEAIREARRANPGMVIEVEVEDEAELSEVLPERPEWVLLDNMRVEQLRRCVDRCRGICLTEASGGVTLDSAAAVAATGVNAISIGCLTHSAPSADLSLEVESLIS